MTRNISKLPPESFIRPRLRVFLSVDIIGSTAHKQKKNQTEFDNKIQVWLQPIAKFFHEFQEIFNTEWRHLKQLKFEPLTTRLGPDPFLWKILGDELVYVKEITDHIEAIAVVECWRQSINTYRKTIRENSLDLKSTAWLSGFPYINAELAFLSNVTSNIDADRYDSGDFVLQNLQSLYRYYEDEVDSNNSHSSNKILIDFIGPAMDTGFRLTGLSNARKMVLSVDLTAMIAFGLSEWDEYLGRMGSNSLPKANSIQFGYDGRQSLKGVRQGKNYPIFWLDMLVPHNTKNIHPEDDLDHLEEGFRTRKPPIQAATAFEFCKRFMQLDKDYPCFPYIAHNAYIKRSKDSPFSKIALNHQHQLREIQNYWVEETKKLEIARQGLLEDESSQSTLKPEPNQVKNSLSKILTNKASETSKKRQNKQKK